MSRARRVVGTQGWTGEMYRWLTPNELVAFKGRSWEEAIGSDDVREQVVVRDIISGKRKPLTSLDASWARTGHVKHSVRPSPDRKYLIWVGAPLGTTNAFEYAVASLRTQRIDLARNPPNFNPVVWLPDSSGWIALSISLVRRGIQYLDIYDRFDIRIRRRIDITDQMNSLSREGYPVLLGWSGMNRLAFWVGYGQAIEKAVELGEIDLGPVKPVITGTRAVFPRGARLHDISLSPDGSRLAWLFEVSKEPVSVDERRGAPRTELWTSDHRGASMVRIGFVPPIGEADTFEGSAHHLKWTPDGKAVSFISGSVLYVRPL